MRLVSGVTVILLALFTACAPRGPVLGSGERPEGVGGTISGSVRAASDKTGLSARMVTAVNIETGQRIQTSTADNGGYTMKVPVGRYRLEVELRPGEALSEQPADLEINRSDVDAQRNFLVTMKSGLTKPVSHDDTRRESEMAGTPRERLTAG